MKTTAFEGRAGLGLSLGSGGLRRKENMNLSFELEKI
jgi:hypothetical protein